ncbi:helix-turn-helix domain-containing protein [Longispora albida]|uniref:helix-turn-helix domain-containing protein n=1 Tax=Longispora albida TaxID=203523 RepID=UPI00035C64F1|nr:LuxR C-terminal-related transcriptional regulator [Longispora albida]
MAYLLEALGISAVEDAVYRELLRQRQANAATLATALSLPAEDMAAALEALLEYGLAKRAAYGCPDYAPVDPDLAVNQLIQQRRRELHDLQLKLDDLTADLRRAEPPGAGSPVEVLRGPDAISRTLTLLPSIARHEILMIDSAPYLGLRPLPNDPELKALQRGVAVRCVYHPSAIAEHDAREFMQECTSAGEQARLHPHAGPKMTIADRELAIVLASSVNPDPEVRLLVRPSPLLDALVSTFESLWERSAPIESPGQIADLPERDRQLLSMLAAGMKDRTIARTLGVTERTVGRRVTELMQRLDAGTRFRAGVRAVQQGWIPAE